MPTARLFERTMTALTRVLRPETNPSFHCLLLRLGVDGQRESVEFDLLWSERLEWPCRGDVLLEEAVVHHTVVVLGVPLVAPYAPMCLSPAESRVPILE